MGSLFHNLGGPEEVTDHFPAENDFTQVVFQLGLI